MHWQNVYFPLLIITLIQCVRVRICLPNAPTGIVKPAINYTVRTRKHLINILNQEKLIWGTDLSKGDSKNSTHYKNNNSQMKVSILMCLCLTLWPRLALPQSFLYLRGWVDIIITMSHGEIRNLHLGRVISKWCM